MMTPGRLTALDPWLLVLALSWRLLLVTALAVGIGGGLWWLFKRYGAETILRAVAPLAVVALMLTGCGIGPAGERLVTRPVDWSDYHAPGSSQALAAQVATVSGGMSLTPGAPLDEFVRRAESVYRGYGLEDPPGTVRRRCWDGGFRWTGWNAFLVECHAALSGRQTEDPVADWRVWSSSGQHHFTVGRQMRECLAASSKLARFVTGPTDPRLTYVPEARAGGFSTGLAELEPLCRQALQAPTEDDGGGLEPCPDPGWSSTPTAESRCRFRWAGDGTRCCWRDTTVGRACRDNPGCIVSPVPDVIPPPAAEVTCPDGQCSSEERADGSCPADCPAEPPPDPEPPADSCAAALDDLQALLDQLSEHAEVTRRECRP